MPNFGGSREDSNKNSNDNEPEVVLPTAAELEEIQRQAHEEGYQAGFAEGAQRMTALLDAMQQAMQHTDNEIAQELLNSFSRHCAADGAAVTQNQT